VAQTHELPHLLVLRQTGLVLGDVQQSQVGILKNCINMKKKQSGRKINYPYYTQLSYILNSGLDYTKCKTLKYQKIIIFLKYHTRISKNLGCQDQNFHVCTKIWVPVEECNFFIFVLQKEEEEASFAIFESL